MLREDGGLYETGVRCSDLDARSARIAGGFRRAKCAEMHFQTHSLLVPLRLEGNQTGLTYPSLNELTWAGRWNIRERYERLEKASGAGGRLIASPSSPRRTRFSCTLGCTRMTDTTHFFSSLLDCEVESCAFCACRNLGPVLQRVMHDGSCNSKVRDISTTHTIRPPMQC